MCWAMCLSYKNQCKRTVCSGNTGKVIYEQIQEGKCYNRRAEVEMGKTWTGAFLSNTEHQGMGAIPSWNMQNTRR